MSIFLVWQTNPSLFCRQLLKRSNAQWIRIGASVLLLVHRLSGYGKQTVAKEHGLRMMRCMTLLDKLRRLG